MITKEQAKVLDAYDLAREIEKDDLSLWEQNMEIINKVSLIKLRKIVGFLSLEGGVRGFRIYALETSCLPRHFIRNAAQDRDPEIRKRARELLGRKRKPLFRINR